MKFDKEDYIAIFLFSILLLICISFVKIYEPTTNQKLSNTFDDKDYDWLNTASLEEYNKTLNYLDVIELKSLIQDNYFYNSYNDSLTNNLPVRNCQYWSYFYYNWFRQHDYEVKYVLFEEHIIVIAKEKSHYFVLDGSTWLRVNLK